MSIFIQIRKEDEKSVSFGSANKYWNWYVKYCDILDLKISYLYLWIFYGI
jgi:hypothetical protein